MGNTSSSQAKNSTDSSAAKSRPQSTSLIKSDDTQPPVDNVNKALETSTTSTAQIITTEAGRHRILDADEVSEATPDYTRDILSPSDEVPSITALLVGGSLPPALEGSSSDDKVNNSTIRTVTGKDFGENTSLVPIILTWTQGGKDVFVTGTFNEWKHKIPLRSNPDQAGAHSTILHLQPGAHRLKFIVDDEWRCSNDLSTATDGNGNLVNYIEVDKLDPSAPPGPPKPVGLVVLSNVGSDISNSPEGSYTSEIPAFLDSHHSINALASPTSTAKGKQSSAFANPPHLPPQLERVILNNPTQAVGSPVHRDDNSVLTTPNHVVLNHLAASSIRNGVLAVASTTRYRKKVRYTRHIRTPLTLQYVTTIFYKPVSM